jgi:hypothetical protein
VVERRSAFDLFDMTPLTSTELARLSAVAAALPPPEGALLRRLIEAAEPRQCRIARRNAAIRATRQVHFPGDHTVAARTLERALIANLPAWRAEKDITTASSRSLALYEILTLSNGKVLGWRRLADIIASN